MPVGSDEAALFETIGVTFDREDRDVGGRAAQDLIGYRFGAGERRLEPHVLAVLLFPLVCKTRIDRRLERFLHNGKAVEGNGDVAAFGRRLWQTARRQQCE